MSFSKLPPGCPPTDAQACIGEIYRLVPSVPVDATGFISQFELYPKKDWKDGCMARGLSVSLSYEALISLRGRVRGLRDFKIVSASLKHEVGLIKQTGPPAHHTWWPEDGVDLPSLFALHASEIL